VGDVTTTAPERLATVTVRYFAAAAAAAGVEEERVTASTVGGLVVSRAQAHGPRLAAVLERSSLLLDGVVVHDRSAPLGDGQTIDVLPPFAGG
jgi:molybdopterin synthase sulfur carrier subunit